MTHRTRVKEWVTKDHSMYQAQARCSCQWSSPVTTCTNHDTPASDRAKQKVMELAGDYARLHKAEMKGQ